MDVATFYRVAKKKEHRRVKLNTDEGPAFAENRFRPWQIPQIYRSKYERLKKKKRKKNEIVTVLFAFPGHNDGKWRK